MIKRRISSYAGKKMKTSIEYITILNDDLMETALWAGYFCGRLALLFMLPMPYMGKHGVLGVPCGLKLSGGYAAPDGCHV